MTTDTFRRLTSRALVALALTGVLAACDNPVDEDPHPDAVAVVVQTSAGVELARATGGGTQGTATGSIPLTIGATRDLRVIFVDAAGNPVPVGGDTSLRGNVLIGALARFEKTSETGGRLTGLSAGTTSVSFDLMHGSHADFQGAAIPLIVTP
ncbi:MAG TPA: hypothetical protein VGR37_18435 [Longimicrobiaceae bacterium]|nr:hypothetical protein [Longimicrobiaceae bacterium]